VEITIYEDRSFSFITKTPPAPELIKKAAGVAKGSPTPHTEKVGSITAAQVREIAQTKMPDLNATSMEAAEKIIAGTAPRISDWRCLASIRAPSSASDGDHIPTTPHLRVARAVFLLRVRSVINR
jgi:hypothetical protein